MDKSIDRMIIKESMTRKQNRKNAIKISSMTLCILMLFNMFFCVSASAADTENYMETQVIVGEEKDNTFTIRGTDIYSGMEAVTSDQQMPYQLSMNKISLQNGNLQFDATVKLGDGETANLSVAGDLYHNEGPFYRDRGGIILMSATSQGSWDVVSCSFLRQGGVEDLLPINRDFDSQPIVQIALRQQANEGVVLFEGLLPSEFDYEALVNQANAAVTNEESGDVRSVNEEVVHIDQIYFAENWKHEALLEFNGELMDGDELERSSLETYSDGRHNPTRVPLAAFWTTGKWISINNPDFPEIGYFASTSFDGTNYQTELISWEYLYKGPEVINTSATGSGTGVLANATLRIISRGTYRYYPSTNSIEDWSSDWAPYALTNAAMIAGLPSGTEIITYSQSTVEGAQDGDFWGGFIGLVLSNYSYGLTDLFNSMTMQSKSDATVRCDYQDTVRGQKNVYGGKVVRAEKIAANGYELRNAGDKIEIKYLVTKPSDITTKYGIKNVSVKYYFNLCGMSGYFNDFSEKITNVTQFRARAYEVK